MRSSIRLRYIVLAVFVFALVAGGVVLSRPAWLFNWREFRAGNEIVSRVETFRARNGKLPENLQDIGIKDPDLNVFYRKIDPDEYCVWFGTTLGESETYNSRNKKWE